MVGTQYFWEAGGLLKIHFCKHFITRVNGVVGPVAAARAALACGQDPAARDQVRRAAAPRHLGHALPSLGTRLVEIRQVNIFWSRRYFYANQIFFNNIFFHLPMFPGSATWSESCRWSSTATPGGRHRQQQQLELPRALDLGQAPLDHHLQHA